MLTGRRIAWGRGFLFALGGLLFLLIFLFVLSLSLPGEAILSMVRPHLAKAGMNLSAEEVRFAFPVSVRMRNADLLLPQGESIRLDSVDASFEPLGLFRGLPFRVTVRKGFGSAEVRTSPEPNPLRTVTRNGRPRNRPSGSNEASTESRRIDSPCGSNRSALRIRTDTGNAKRTSSADRFIPAFARWGRTIDRIASPGRLSERTNRKIRRKRSPPRAHRNPRPQAIRLPVNIPPEPSAHSEQRRRDQQEDPLDAVARPMPWRGRAAGLVDRDRFGHRREGGDVQVPAPAE